MNGRVFYNEIDPFAAAWLRRLIAAGLIPAGDVDERDIRDILPSDLDGYDQCHFFAGIGGWPEALRLAGYASTPGIWTGSCPCQPFSAAGRRGGFADERHLWPAFFHLIRECRPARFFGEQVATAADWLGLVRSDLEAVGYAVGAIPMEAASAGADHFRDRYWIVADAEDRGQRREPAIVPKTQGFGVREVSRQGGRRDEFGPRCKTGALADSEHGGRQGRDAEGRWPGAALPSSEGFLPRLVEHATSFGWGEGWTEHELRSRGISASVASIDDRQFIECPDGKWRRLPPPRVRWLGVGVPSRVDLLRGFGNAIDPRPAAEFIQAALDPHAMIGGKRKTEIREATPEPFRDVLLDMARSAGRRGSVNDQSSSAEERHLTGVDGVGSEARL